LRGGYRADGGSLKSLAIVALGKGWEKAPWKKRTHDIWTLNSAWRRFGWDLLWKGWKAPSALSAYFELHTPRYLREEWGKSRAHFENLAELRVPVYVQDAKAWPTLWKPTTLPRAAIGKAFPRGDYHASSIDWMLAMGLHLGYKRIDVYGTGFGPTDGGEPISARAAFEYWVGFAEGLGVKVTVHEPTGAFWIYNVTKERTPYHFDDSWRLVEDR